MELYGAPYHNPGMFNGNLPTVQDDSFLNTVIGAPNLRDQGTNRQAPNNGNSSKHYYEIHRAEGNLLCCNDTYSTASNAMHFTKPFFWKDRKCNGNDNESYDEFVDQYLAALCDLCLSPSERLQNFQNLFHREAL